MAQWRNTKQRYGLTAQLMHWITAAMILGLMVGGVVMHELPAETSAQVAIKSQLYSVHKTIGTAVLILALVRIAWAAAGPRPQALNGEKRLESWAAHTIHYSLYVAIIAMPVSGWLHHSATAGFAPVLWPFGQALPFVPKTQAVSEFFMNMHGLFALVIVLSLVLHIGGALKHALIDKDGTLSRMVPGMRTPLAEADFTQDLGKRLSWTIPTILALGFLGAVGYGLQLKNIEQTAAPTHGSAEALSASGNWIVRPNESTLGITVEQFGGAVTGSFNSWSAEITFDPEQLENSTVNVTIDTGSLDLGAQTGDAVGEQFLNADAFTKATFTADRFIQTGDDAYEAVGALTLLGVSQPLALPFKLTIENGVASMSSLTTINRMDWMIGATGFADEGTVKHSVEIAVELVADRAE